MSDIHKLKNEILEITVIEQGAELTSIFSETNNLEYLWQADASFWPRYAPVLFPVVGKLKDDKYQFADKEYSMSQHGFARDKVFKFVQSEDANELIFVLTDNEETLKNYPFQFEFWVIYSLELDTLKITYKVKNTGTNEMYFSLGGHPAFNCPLRPNEAFEDYYLEFEKEEKLDRFLLLDGLLTRDSAPLETDKNILHITEDLFAKDALVFKNLSSNYVILKSDKSENGVSFSFEDFPYLGIWKKPGASFICMEPWFGVADSITTNHDFTHKEGIRTLEAGEEFECSYSIIPF